MEYCYDGRRRPYGAWRRSRQSLLTVKPIAQAAHAHEIPGPRGLVFKLAAEIVDVCVDNPIGQEDVRSPDKPQEIVDAEHLAAVLEEDAQQLEFKCRQIDGA